MSWISASMISHWGSINFFKQRNCPGKSNEPKVVLPPRPSPEQRLHRGLPWVAGGTGSGNQAGLERMETCWVTWGCPYQGPGWALVWESNGQETFTETLLYCLKNCFELTTYDITETYNYRKLEEEKKPQLIKAFQPALMAPFPRVFLALSKGYEHG